MQLLHCDVLYGHLHMLHLFTYMICLPLKDSTTFFYSLLLSSIHVNVLLTQLYQVFLRAGAKTTKVMVFTNPFQRIIQLTQHDFQ